MLLFVNIANHTTDYQRHDIYSKGRTYNLHSHITEIYQILKQWWKLLSHFLSA